MPTESDLRDRMRPPRPGGSGGLDAAAVVRASRRRRRPKMLLAGASAFVVAAAIVVPAAALGLRSGSASSSAGSAVDTARQPTRERSGGGPNAVGQDPCPALPGPDSAAVSGRLELSDATAGGDVRGTLVLSATATTTVTANGSAIIVLLHDGAVVGQAAAPLSTDPIAVSPGSDVRLPITFRPVRCGVDTALPTGDYSARVILPTAGDAVASGPGAELHIR